jgi:hypothetical protein
VGLALVVREDERVFRRMRRCLQRDVALEQAMAEHPQAGEHGAAERDRVVEGAPSTFSMTYGSPDCCNVNRTGATSSG